MADLQLDGLQLQPRTANSLPSEQPKEEETLSVTRQQVPDELSGTFTVSEVTFRFTRRGLSVLVNAYMPDPNAPAPIVFRGDATQGLGPSAPLVAGSAPPSGEIPQRIYDAAKAAFGRSTRNAQATDGGNLACAYAVNAFAIVPAGLQNLGSTVGPEGFTLAVRGVVDALNGGRGQRISRAEAVPGDIWVSPNQAHVGVCMATGCSEVLSNSSSRAAFAWQDDIESVNRYYGSSQEFGIWRVTG